MPKIITQKVVFKNTNCQTLYQLYMNAKLHSKVTGATAKITDKEGAAFSAHGGYCSGKNLLLIKDQLIVQTWRASDWSNSDVDSIFMIHLENKGKNVVLNCLHANLPDAQAASIDDGWYQYYWKPWKAYLSSGKK